MRVSSVVRVGVLAAILCIVGCNSNNKGKIEGTKWSSQEFTAKSSGKSTAVPKGSVKFEFTTDGKVTYWILDKPYTGRYSLGSGDYVTLYLNEELAGSKTHRQRIIIKGDTMQLIDTDGTSITFDRSK